MKKSLHIKKISVSPLDAPLIQPFRTALGEHTSLQNILLTLELSNGVKGFGEAAVAPHITGETIAETEKNLKSVGQRLVGREAGDYLRLSCEFHEALPKNKCALAAFEMALMDALTRTWKMPLWKFFGPKPVKLISDITIVISRVVDAEDTAGKFYRFGFRSFKIKIGRDEYIDLKRVAAVKRAAPAAAIYLDANQGYSAEATLHFVKKLIHLGITPELIEQPVPKDDWEGLVKFTKQSPIAVCADESVSSLADAVRAIHDKAVHIINVKLMKCGLFEAREIAILAKANGMKLMIGGMMESSLAMTASAHLAAGLNCFDYVDLDTPFFIKDGLRENPYLNKHGVYDLKKVQAGIGITP